MTQSAEDRVLLIKKLLAKAEAKGTTEAERDTFNAKATQLMTQWAIDEALLTGDDRKEDKIVTREFHTDVPKSFSYEYAKIGIQVANALGAHGLFQRTRDGRTVTLVVGYESDLERIGMLIQSLTLQATLALVPWYRRWLDDQPTWMTPNGTAKFNAKRSFITGFAAGVKVKLTAVFRATVSSAGHGAELVLVDRTKQVASWMNDNLAIGNARQRRYTQDGHMAGERAGTRADIGQGGVTNTGRPAIGS